VLNIVSVHEDSRNRDIEDRKSGKIGVDYEKPNVKLPNVSGDSTALCPGGRLLGYFKPPIGSSKLLVDIGIGYSPFVFVELIAGHGVLYSFDWKYFDDYLKEDQYWSDFLTLEFDISSLESGGVWLNIEISDLPHGEGGGYDFATIAIDNVRFE